MKGCVKGANKMGIMKKINMYCNGIWKPNKKWRRLFCQVKY